MDEIDEEAKRARMQGPKTGANWDLSVICLLLDFVSVLHLTRRRTHDATDHIPWLLCSFFVILRQLDLVLIWRQLCGWLKTKCGVVLKKLPVSGKDQSADLIMTLEATL